MILERIITRGVLPRLQLPIFGPAGSLPWPMERSCCGERRRPAAAP